MAELPFTYMDLAQVLAAAPYRSKSVLYEAIAAGKFPRSDCIGGRALWRSDRVAAAIADFAAQVEAQRPALQERSDRLAQARVDGARKARLRRAAADVRQAGRGT